MTNIVFSKDRALQLHAFLRSCPCAPVHVLYATTSKEHARAYDEVFDLCKQAVPHVQTAFKVDLLQLLPFTGNVVFFVDDQVFVRTWDLQEVPGLSLRLGRHLTRCYPTDVAQPLPSFYNAPRPFLCWMWSEGQGDWGYPLSLDGHVFDLRELRPWIEASQFSSPNTLEMALQQFMPQMALTLGFCYPRSRVVNVPWNRVQQECPNRHADSCGVDEMLGHWQAGRQIDLNALRDVVNISCHQEFPLVLEPRA